MQLPGNGGPNGNPIQNNGGSVTKAQVNILKISPIIVEKTAAQIETILPTQPIIKQQQQPPTHQPQQPPIQQQQHPAQQPQKSPSTNSKLT